MEIESRRLGATGLQVFPLGLGTGQLGETRISTDEARRVLDEALEQGIRLFDTADSYGDAPERLRPWLKHARQRIVLSVKASPAEWSPSAIQTCIDSLLRRLDTENVDIVRLRTIPGELVESEELLGALSKVRLQGKARLVAFSGENRELERAVLLDFFDAFMTSVNICDQRSARTAIPRATAAGRAVIAKRPLANAPWRFEERPRDHYGEPYWERFSAMGLSPRADWSAYALRFSAFTPGVDVCLVGTANAAHLRELTSAIRQGPLPAPERSVIEDAFARYGSDWPGLV